MQKLHKFNLWKCGTVVERQGEVHYLFQLDDAYVLERHYNQQLRAFEIVPIRNPLIQTKLPVPRKRSFATFGYDVQQTEIPTRYNLCTKS